MFIAISYGHLFSCFGHLGRTNCKIRLREYFSPKIKYVPFDCDPINKFWFWLGQRNRDKVQSAALPGKFGFHSSFMFG